MSLAPLPDTLPPILKHYLPSCEPFVTLTYAQSLDSRIAAAPGERTHISHAQTKTMTHYIRSFHDAIMVGINTVLADNPSLNSRYIEGQSNIRPVVIDPNFRFGNEEIQNFKLITNYKSGAGLKPLFVVSELTNIDQDYSEFIDIIFIKPIDGTLPWEDIFKSLHDEDLQSIMVEGGAKIINTLLLRPDLINSVIITIGPIFLGSKGVEVSPSAQLQLKNIKWWHDKEDSVIFATLK